MRIMVDALKLFAVCCVTIAVVVLWLGVGSGLIDMGRFLPQSYERHIKAGGPDTTTGFGLYDRQKERGR